MSVGDGVKLLSLIPLDEHINQIIGMTAISVFIAK